MSLLIILAFHNVVHWIWLFIAHINIFAMYLYDGDTNFKNHGFFNRMILVFTIISILVLYATSRWAIFVCRKGKFYILASKFDCLNLVQCVVVFLCWLSLFISNLLCRAAMDGRKALAVQLLTLIAATVRSTFRSTANSRSEMAGLTSTSSRNSAKMSKWLSKKVDLVRVYNTETTSDESGIRESRTTHTLLCKCYHIVFITEF